MNLITLKILFLTFSPTLFKSKTLKIHNRNQHQTNVNTPSNKINLLHAQITLPYNSFSNIIENNLNKLGIKTVTLSSKMICDLLHSRSQHTIIPNASVDCIPCKNCKWKYVGDMSRNNHNV